MAFRSISFAVSIFVLSTSVHAAVVSGGGGTQWSLGNYGVSDGGIGQYWDAYDGAFYLEVDGSYYYDPDGYIQSGQTGIYSASSMSGLNVSQEVYIDSASPTARVVHILENPTASDIVINYQSWTNMGSDGSGIVSDSSNGVANTFDHNDRWVISEDTATGDPVTTFINYGAGATYTPSSISNSIEAGGFLVNYDNLLVAAGESVLFLSFLQMHSNLSAAQSGVAVFDTLSADSSLLTGLSSAELANVVNWDFAAVPVPAAAWLFGSGVISLVGVARRKKA